MTQTIYSLSTHVFQIKTGEKGKCDTRPESDKDTIEEYKIYFKECRATVQVTFIIKAGVLIPDVL